MSDDTLAEPDRVAGAPHPRETQALFGQDDAEARFLDAWRSGRMHHAWLMTGPTGIGKATLAWRIARFVLSQPLRAEEAGLFGAGTAPKDTLDVDPDHPVARRLAALSEPGLFLLRRGPNRKGDALMTEIGVDEVRKLGGFFAMSSTDGGRRVVIVDAADELNTNAANALLKVLEEPPAEVLMLLVSHQPARLLPTIRSRCRELRMAALGPEPLAQALAATGTELPDDAVALAELSGGSVGQALRLVTADGLKTYTDLVAALADAPRLDRPRAIALAERAGTRGATDKREVGFRLVDLLLGRLARSGAGHPPVAEAATGEARMLARLSPDTDAARTWAELQAELSARTGHGRAVNLDPATLILDTIIKINDTAGRLTSRV